VTIGSYLLNHYPFVSPPLPPRSSVTVPPPLFSHPSTYAFKDFLNSFFNLPHPFSGVFIHPCSVILFPLPHPHDKFSALGGGCIWKSFVSLGSFSASSTFLFLVDLQTRSSSTRPVGRQRHFNVESISIAVRHPLWYWPIFLCEVLFPWVLSGSFFRTLDLAG